MNCAHVRGRLPDLIYGDVPPGESVELEKHLAHCPACREEYAALRRVRGLLDAVPAPAVSVDVRQVFQRAAQVQEQRLRRWRRVAVALATAAAVLLVALALQLEVRVEAHQVVVRWGSPPPAVVPVPPPSPPVYVQARPVPSSVGAEEVQLLKDLIHALAANAEARDRQQQVALARLQGRLDTIQSQAHERWTATERYVSALYTAHFRLPEKGAKP
jgi:anti-sigma factor RsiW